MKKILVVVAFAAAIIALVGYASGAFAQTVSDAGVYHVEQMPPNGPEDFRPDGSVSVPWGDLLSEALKGLLLLVGSAAAFALRKSPAALVSALDMFARLMGQSRANELLEKAITYGINTTAGAVKGKVLSVKVGNEVLERAFEYAVRHAPNLVKALGGIAQLREKIIARLDLVEEAAIPAPRPPAEALVQEAPAPASS